MVDIDNTKPNIGLIQSHLIILKINYLVANIEFYQKNNSIAWPIKSSAQLFSFPCC